MQKFQTIERLVNLLDDSGNVIFNMDQQEAVERVGSGDPDRVREIEGQFAIVHKQGKTVRLARSIGRPMRYFLAKLEAGPLLIIAERMDEIREHLEKEGIADQFHPTYTRMVPAHHVTELSLIGCPDPNPIYSRFVQAGEEKLSADITVLGEAYVSELDRQVGRFLDRMPKDQPIGVLFSGGIDSGAILLLTYHKLLQRGEAPQRLKAFTLNVGGSGSDFKQATDFLRGLRLDYLIEEIDADLSELDYKEAIRVIEDYKPLDVQAATMTNLLLRKIRERYPDWRFVLDGDGGDENLRDYPIEENPELTVRSVLSNSFFYHEGWGVDKIKHSQTYSGGQSRGHVRSSATARAHGFVSFSPFATPSVIEVAERIPFVELTDWDHDKLYALKGQITAAGVSAITGLEMPVFEKTRFQRGAVDADGYDSVFPADESEYRRAFADHFQL